MSESAQYLTTLHYVEGSVSRGNKSGREMHNGARMRDGRSRKFTSGRVSRHPRNLLHRPEIELKVPSPIKHPVARLSTLHLLDDPLSSPYPIL